MARPFIVGIGGTPKPQSTTEQALALALASAAANGARTEIFPGDVLARLPLFLTPGSEDSPDADRLIAAARQADGVIFATPGYHGTVSGLVKNAIDYLERTARDARPYLDGMPVGLIVTASGWQATGSTLSAMRSIVHALRGWPTPLGAAINTSGGIFRDGECIDRPVAAQLELVGKQVADFASMRLFASMSVEPTLQGS